MPLQVLVMESDPMVTRTLGRVFRDARPEFFAARTLDEAASLLAALKVDVVVVDEAIGIDSCLGVLELARTQQPAAHRFLLVDDFPRADSREVPATTLARSWFGELWAPLESIPTL